MLSFKSVSIFACLCIISLTLVDARSVESIRSKDRYISTPSGRIRHDCVHSVPSGSTLRENKNGLLDVILQDGKFQRTIPKCDKSKNKLPMFDISFKKRTVGARPPPRGDHLRHGNMTGIITDPPVFPADYDGWLAYTAWHDPTGIDAFLGKFSVPDAPAQYPDVMYIFTGLQNIDWIPIRDPNPDGFDIIQPVLQYPGDTGVGYSVKSWYVTEDDGAIASDEVILETGDYVFGNMTQTGTTEWYIGSTSGQTGANTNITVSRPRLAGQFWAYNTLECYGCIDCTTYPSKYPSHFTDLQLFKSGELLSPHWLLNPKPNPSLKCQETIDIFTPQAQVIIFHN